MLIKNLALAFRMLIRNKSFSITTILGLSIGLQVLL